MLRIKGTDKNTEGVWGIRTRVWLLIFVTMLGCLMLIWLLPNPTRTTASNSPPTNKHSQQTQHIISIAHRSSPSPLPARQTQTATSPEPPEVRLDFFEQ